MNKLRDLNIAGKITSSFRAFNLNKMTAFFTYFIIVLVIIAILYSVYLYLLNQNLLDVVFHSTKVYLSSSVSKNIPSTSLPKLSAPTYSLSARFAVDKSHYVNKKTDSYSHLISYQNDDDFGVGVWIENKTNNIYVVYKTEDGSGSNYMYNPNSDSFHTNNTATITNYLLNEWNLITIVVNKKNLFIYLNGKLYETKINGSNINYNLDQTFRVDIGKEQQIEGVMKCVRFRNYCYQAYEIEDLYFAGPNKLNIPDIRKTTYLSDNFNINMTVGSKKSNILDFGADLIDGALDGMTAFFKQF